MKALYLLPLTLLCSACVNTQKLGTYWIPRGQKVYENKNETVDGATQTYLYTHELKNGLVATIKPIEEEHELAITIRSEGQSGDLTTTRVRGDAALMVKDYKYFPYHKAAAPLPEMRSSRASQRYFTKGDKFVYWESSPIFQAITIPIKLRPAIGEREYSASGAFNVGFSYGRKFTRNVYQNFYNKSDMKVLNRSIKKFTVAPGVFFGPTLIELDAANTDGAVTADRTVIGTTVGVMGVIALNQVNLGLATGLDTSYGTEPEEWVYRNEPWIGIVVSLDFLK